MSIGQQYGWPAIFQVGSVFVGYALLAWFVQRFVPAEWIEQKNVFAAADGAIARATGAKSWFGPTITVWMLVFFILVLAFEAYIAGNVLAPLLAPVAPANFAACVSFVLLGVAMVCAVIGGWKAVLATDKLQIIAVLVVITVLLIAAVKGGPEGATAVRPALDMHGWTTLGLLCAFAVATQFYSPVNWGIVTNLKRNQVATFLVGGGLASLLLGMLTVGGVIVAVAPGSAPLQTLLDRLHAAWATPDVWGSLAAFVVVIGAVSMILSTADSAILKLVMLAYDNVLGRDSKAVQNDPKELRRIRACVVGAFLVAFVPLAVLWITRPQVIFILVATVTGLNVLAPLTVAVPILNRLGGLHLLRRWVFVAISFIVCSTSVLALYFAVQGANNAVTWTSFGALLASVFFCAGLVAWAAISAKSTR